MPGSRLWICERRLTTAEILYHMPDHPDLLQSYLWQDYDLVPNLPVLRKFLGFWERELDGKLHSVRVAYRTSAKAPAARFAKVSLALH
jgi:uncharacterized protein Usg